MNRPSRLTILAAASGALAALGLGGCKKEEIRVYSVAKETAAPAMENAAPPPEPAANPAAGRPRITYTLPAGWQDDGSSPMSLANLHVKTAAGEVTVNITPLGNLAGKEDMVVNMWRDQFGQPPLGAGELATVLTPVEIGGNKGQVFEISGDRQGQVIRIVTAFEHRDGTSWFYKLQGPDAAVAAQKAAFLDFLKTVRITAGGAAAVAEAPAQSPEPAAKEFKWKVPEGWQTLAAGAMQVAKFSVATKEGAKAEVTVSVFPSESGGLLANVNRWRRQLGLEPVEEEALKAPMITSFPAQPSAKVVDLQNGGKALLGAIVPREDQWWFYKLMGEAPAVNAEHDAFVSFVQTAP